MTYNAAQRKDVRKAEKESAIAERERGLFVKGLMSTIAGRSWVLDLLEACNCFREDFTGNALFEAFAKGQRTVGLRLLDDLMRYCPDEYILMMRERNIRDAARGSSDRKRSGDQDGDGDDQGSSYDDGSRSDDRNTYDGSSLR